MIPIIYHRQAFDNKLQYVFIKETSEKMKSLGHDDKAFLTIHKIQEQMASPQDTKDFFTYDIFKVFFDHSWMSRELDNYIDDKDLKADNRLKLSKKQHL